MTERQQKILRAVIEEYIRQGNAIGSGLLHKRYNFGVSPALIRAELRDLMEQGYLMQPHTSGGRIPTDKGYRFLVDDILHELEADKVDEIKKMKRYLRSLLRSSFEDMIDDMARRLHALGVGYSYDTPEIYKRGFDALIEGIDISEKDDFVQIAKDFEALDEKRERVLETVEEDRENPQVFIGEKSPFTESSETAVLAEQYRLPAGQRVVIMIVGPKRMDYRQNILLMKAIKKNLKKK